MDAKFYKQINIQKRRGRGAIPVSNNLDAANIYRIDSVDIPLGLSSDLKIAVDVRALASPR